MKSTKQKATIEMTNKELDWDLESFFENESVSNEHLGDQIDIRESDHNKSYHQKNNPKVRMAKNGRCKAILAQDITASQKVEAMVRVFLEKYPSYILPVDKTLHHPSVLALHGKLHEWLIKQCGHFVEFWQLILTAAKEWFPDKRDSKLGKHFCFTFECLDCTFWHGGGEMTEICKEYGEWIYGHLSQTPSSTDPLAQTIDGVKPDMRDGQKESAIAYAQIWNSGHCSAFFDLLDVNCRYASQWVFQEMRSKEEIESYLRGKVDAINKNGSKVKAEVGKIRAPNPGDWCVLMYQGNSDEVTALVTFTISNGKIVRFDMCLPGLFSYKKTGQLPTSA